MSRTTNWVYEKDLQIEVSNSVVEEQSKVKVGSERYISREQSLHTATETTMVVSVTPQPLTHGISLACGSFTSFTTSVREMSVVPPSVPCTAKRRIDEYEVRNSDLVLSP